MALEQPRRLTVTVRTRQGQVLDVELDPEQAAEVDTALIQMVTALFDLVRPDLVRSVTFDIDRPA
jgi:hypothetical protein